VLFLYGKKQVRLPQLIGGLLLMIYPYFRADVSWMLAIGAALDWALVGESGLGGEGELGIRIKN